MLACLAHAAVCFAITTSRLACLLAPGHLPLRALRPAPPRVYDRASARPPAPLATHAPVCDAYSCSLGHALPPTGDNVLTAHSIASQCGIFTAGGIIMEGPVFRKLSIEEQREIVPCLQVLARSSPEDKRILVDTLKALGEIVGVTGDGTNDGPALKHTNVGFSMGIAGTEIAKEASDIILMDNNFALIVSAIMWGCCVNDPMRKFLQFQVSVNITAVLITFISAVSSDEEESVLTVIQLLWINIIMDTSLLLHSLQTPHYLNCLTTRWIARCFRAFLRKNRGPNNTRGKVMVKLPPN
ncbi:plasma membrane calcium [Ceratobasidium sp. UAMH 11750]|nr:plasma membrane calcium [Ceratobasidium sp. UAMH 11750]